MEETIYKMEIIKKNKGKPKSAALSVFFIALTLTMMLLAVPPASAASPALKATLVKYEPAPAEPGGYVDVWIKIENKGDGSATDAEFEIVPEYPFMLEPGVSAVKMIGKLWPLQQVVIDYRLRVDDDALEGSSTVDFRLRTDSAGDWTNSGFDMSIQSKRINVGISGIESDPYVITPGDYSTVTLNVKNFGESSARDLVIKFDTSADETPFSTVNSTTEQYLKLLEGGSEETFTFKVLASSSAAAGAYKVPTTITYYDRSGNAYSKEDTASLVIGTTTSIQVALSSSTMKQPGTSGKIIVMVTNNGLAGLKFVTLRLSESDDSTYQMLSAPQEYLGNIDSDDSENAEFEIYVSNSTIAPATLTIPVTIEYTDASTNQKGTLNADVGVRLYSYAELLDFGMIQKPNYSGLFVILAIVLIVIAIVVIRKIMRKRKEQHHKTQ